MKDLSQNLNNVSSRLKQACLTVGRDPSEVRILAVSKRHPGDNIRALSALGQRAFGENIVTEGVEEMPGTGRSWPRMALHWPHSVQQDPPDCRKF